MNKKQIRIVLVMLGAFAAFIIVVMASLALPMNILSPWFLPEVGCVVFGIFTAAVGIVIVAYKLLP